MLYEAMGHYIPILKLRSIEKTKPSAKASCVLFKDGVLAVYRSAQI